VFGGEGATIAGKMFYPLDKIVFASDCPFDPEKGPMYIRETLRLIEKMDWSKEERAQVYYKNLERITGKRFVK
jgi:aminocarboxymuconate-semialdehyde decarboxylase